MTTEDKLGAEIVTTVKPNDAVEQKRHITDEETIAQMEREEAARRLEEACEVFLAAEHWFQRINAHPGKVSDPHVNLRWWAALEEVFQKEKIVQRLFVGPNPTLEQNKLYAKFREVLVAGNKSRMKANA